MEYYWHDIASLEGDYIKRQDPECNEQDRFYCCCPKCLVPSNLPSSSFITCSGNLFIGKCNPQLVNRDIRKLMPTRTILLIICIGCIWFQNLQYWVRKLPAIATICNETEPCANFVLAQLYRLQNGILQSLALALAGICSGQLVGTFKKVLNNTDLHNNALLFKETKTSLSLLLLVNLSFLIIDCIIKTYVFCYVRTNTEFGLRFVFAFSFVTYYCLALDDCFVALKEHISDLRFSFLYNFFFVH